jgi:hypothetical protein
VGRDVEVVQAERVVHGVPVRESRRQKWQSQEHGCDRQEQQRGAYGRVPHTSGWGDGRMISYTSISR